MSCNCCEITDHAFSEAEAQAQVRQYRRNGPPKQTELLLEAIHSLEMKNATLLDIGGGIGIIYHELLGETVGNAIHVDASSAYLKAAKAEAARRGHRERITFIHADFTDVAGDLPEVDIVTLDRVVCCYPNFRALLKAATDHARAAVVLTYPRETWYFRLFVKAANIFQRLRRDPFRVFLHPVAEMDAQIKREGFERVSLRRLIVWEVAFYRKMRA